MLSWPSLVHIVVKSRLIRFLNLFFPCTIKLSLAKKIAKFFFYVILVVELHFLFFTKIVFNLTMLIPFVEFSAVRFNYDANNLLWPVFADLTWFDLISLGPTWSDLVRLGLLFYRLRLSCYGDSLWVYSRVSCVEPTCKTNTELLFYNNNNISWYKN